MLCLNMKSLLLLRVIIINIACKQNQVVTLKNTPKKNFSHSKMKKGENKLSKQLKCQSATLSASIAKKRN